MRWLAAVLAISAVLLAVPALSHHDDAQAAVASAAAISRLDGRALSWAETQVGHPYVWGGTGPGYDCSGLVYAAFRHLGIRLPRSTYAMLGSWHLRRVPWWQARRGDLAFYGSGHVEFLTMWHSISYGAHDYGTVVGWIHWNSWWHPSAFYEVIP